MSWFDSAPGLAEKSVQFQTLGKETRSVEFIPLKKKENCPIKRVY